MSNPIKGPFNIGGTDPVDPNPQLKDTKIKSEVEELQETLEQATDSTNPEEQAELINRYVNQLVSLANQTTGLSGVEAVKTGAATTGFETTIAAGTLIEAAITYKILEGLATQIEEKKNELKSVETGLKKDPKNKDLIIRKDNLEREINELVKERDNKVFNLNVESPLVFTELISVANEFLPLDEHISEFIDLVGPEVKVGLGAVASVKNIVSLVKEIGEVTNEIEKINKDILELKKDFKKNQNLIELLSVKQTHLEKIKRFRLAAKLINEILKLTKSVGSATGGITSALALKGAIISSLHPAVAALLGGSIAIALTLQVDSERSNIKNFFHQIPLKLQLASVNKKIAKELELVKILHRGSQLLRENQQEEGIQLLQKANQIAKTELERWGDFEEMHRKKLVDFYNKHAKELGLDGYKQDPYKPGVFTRLNENQQVERISADYYLFRLDNESRAEFALINNNHKAGLKEFSNINIHTEIHNIAVGYIGQAHFASEKELASQLVSLAKAEIGLFPDLKKQREEIEREIFKLNETTKVQYRADLIGATPKDLKEFEESLGGIIQEEQNTFDSYFEKTLSEGQFLQYKSDRSKWLTDNWTFK